MSTTGVIVNLSQSSTRSPTSTLALNDVEQGREDLGPSRSPRPLVGRVIHLKLTPWRFLNTAVLVELGVPKLVLTLRGETTTPTNLDWTLSIVWALTSYWVGLVEQEIPTIAPWLFTYDIGWMLWIVLAELWAMRTPITSEDFASSVCPARL
ncbi:hypothetical protein C8R44DRAFT_195357 [Mycena epipterygia]|nr:hypothetical protein C8R44DRAFT_195357 [Mycena epipterygia]